MGKAKAGADRHLGADDAVAAEEVLLAAEHVHRAALAVRIAAAAPGQFGHDPLRVHAAGQHVAVVAIGGDDRVALLERRLHADDDRLLADIEMAEAADQPHPVHLPGPLLEAADQQHVGILALERVGRDVRLGGLDRLGLALDCHLASSGLPPKHGVKPRGLQPHRRQFLGSRKAGCRGRESRCDESRVGSRLSGGRPGP